MMYVIELKYLLYYNLHISFIIRTFTYMNKENIIQYNDKGQNHGYWELYSSDEIWYKSLFVNGRKFGYEEHTPITLYKPTRVILNFHL